MDGLAKLSFRMPFSNSYHEELINIAARREAELNSKYRKTLEELQIPESSPMHQFLKHNWEEDLKALHEEHEQARRNPKSFVEQHREKYLGQKTEPSPWNTPQEPPATDPSPQSRMESREEAARQRREKIGIGAKGTASALGWAGAGATVGYQGAQAFSNRQQ
jgi:hypothetical protein